MTMKLMTDTRRNPVAADLRTPKYRKRVVKSKVKYDRKQTKKGDRNDYRHYQQKRRLGY